MRRVGDANAANVVSAVAGLIKSVMGWLVVRTSAVTLATLVVGTLFVGRADAFVYWSESSIGTVGRANLDGSGINLTFISGLDEPQGITIDSAHIYWITPLGTIGRASLDGTGVKQDFIAGVLGAKALAVDSGHIYWTSALPSGNHVGRANLDGTGVNLSFIPTAIPAAGLAVDGAHIYWTNSGINAIGRANLDGSGANQTFITGAANPQGVAVDSAHIYWANGNSTTIGRANVDGSGANEFFIFAGKPGSIAVDGAHVWWTNGPSFYAIGRANLDGTGINERFIDTLSTPSSVAVNSLTALTGSPRPPTIMRLVDDIDGLGLPHGIERSLLAKLGAAQGSVDAGDVQDACDSLEAFINEVRAQTDNKLDGDPAAKFVSDATAIRKLLGCVVE